MASSENHPSLQKSFELLEKIDRTIARIDVLVGPEDGKDDRRFFQVFVVPVLAVPVLFLLGTFLHRTLRRSKGR